jgi:lysophospholipase L1-like esterase
MTRRWAAGAGLALAAALVTGCTSPKDDRDRPNGGDEYVALGDSYTAATNTGQIEQPLDGCGRSTTNYPHQVADELGMDLTDVSCNGASTRELTVEQTRNNYTIPPQLDAVGKNTELVTIGLGGNDSYFLARISNCVSLFRDQSGTPCTDLDEKAGADSTAAQLPKVEDNLIAALGEIRDRAPNARILVVGYPQPFPAEGTCDLLPLPPGDYAWARSIVERLNDALATAAKKEDVTYVDVAGPSEGHDICSDDPWVAGEEVSLGSSSPLHPYPQEVDAVADLVVAAVKQDE